MALKCLIWQKDEEAGYHEYKEYKFHTIDSVVSFFLRNKELNKLWKKAFKTISNGHVS